MSQVNYERLIGGFSKPGKMPGLAWSITAHRCITGSKLAKIPGSVCSQCYALKGRYAFPNVQKALERREQAWRSTPPNLWVDNFVKALEYRYRNAAPADMYFRWFDSGDLRSVGMLKQICQIADATGSTHHWLPTREVGIVRDWQKQRCAAPANLVIRLSAPMVDDAPAKWWPTTSTVVKDHANATCPAPNQSNKCGSCRACWSPVVSNVAYAAH